MSDLDVDAIEPFDQERHLGRPPWKNGLAVEAWEKAHGHDVRVKCYVEYGCLAIEAENERLRERVATLEGGIRVHRNVAESILRPVLRLDRELWSLLPESHDQEGTDDE